ncbi:MAG TPA: dihydrofolate reductase [Cyanobacteria bacterium UBA11149]|nr:dihydrofolate reductase [Cyanobacteria bacterium UBA11367]HBE57933.1 dihydrofolate reductase [Cyanobacteria bacterium UBA11366]HBR74702.1 dihydrofolate reductase [Cyanobacteria bacterium UBA11159]HBS70179.1 dihydrofolate reductase [Cyanobacteria bacterium UBA11153]HBW89922.1 dihydrofolate reductase [Cyanobacteria bacterium UBA11149]HCA95590.1 dihydrofolate reductase [Cyanobacteria bacterium UBA9226]
MTKFILYIATSLDGYIARLDGSIDWLPSPEADGEANSYTKFYNSIDALIMGSKTYEQVLGFGDWVYPGKLSYILTSRDLSTPRNDIFFVKGDIPEVIENINKKNYQRVWVVGGGKVASSFISQGLIDEYIITVIPIILGSGISLYQSLPEVKLDFIQLKSYSSGMVELCYKRK